jgi:hypothetical protein
LDLLEKFQLLSDHSNELPLQLPNTLEVQPLDVPPPRPGVEVLPLFDIEHVAVGEGNDPIF